jgi:ElaB/YqjD/DUF883 family membrane-anchored ribosome-binding protein
MGETPDDIKNELEQARARLGQDLNRLEYRVRTELDWRVHFDRHPWQFCGAAFGVGLLLGFAFAPSRNDFRARPVIR